MSGKRRRGYLNKSKDVKSIVLQKEELSKREKRLQKRISFSSKNIEENNEIKISDHAVVRYMERVKGIDIEQIKAEIISEDMKNYINFCNGYGNVSNGKYRAVVRNNIIVTINTD